MNKHITTEYLSQFKSRDLIKLACEYCKEIFKRKQSNILRNNKKSNIVLENVLIALNLNQFLQTAQTAKVI